MIWVVEEERLWVLAARSSLSFQVPPPHLVCALPRVGLGDVLRELVHILPEVVVRADHGRLVTQRLQQDEEQRGQGKEEGRDEGERSQGRGRGSHVVCITATAILDKCEGGAASLPTCSCMRNLEAWMGLCGSSDLKTTSDTYCSPQMP